MRGGGARRPGPVCGLLWAASSPDSMILSRGATCPSACKALSGRGYPQPSPAAPRPRRGDSRSLPSRGPGRPQPLRPCPSSRVSSRALCCVFPDGVTFTGPACAAGRAPVGAEPQLQAPPGPSSGWAKRARPTPSCPTAVSSSFVPKKENDVRPPRWPPAPSARGEEKQAGGGEGGRARSVAKRCGRF